MRVLAVDTTSERGSVAVVDDGVVRGEVRLLAGSQHSDRLFRSVRFLLECAETDLSSVDVFVAVRGPGSFTGLRVGLSAALGFAMACRRPVFGVSSLRAAAWKCGLPNGRIHVWLDAHRGEVYAAAFASTPEGLCADGGECVIQPADWLDRMDHRPAVFCGSGAERYQDLIEGAGHRVHVMSHFFAASAAEMVIRGWHEPAEPLYVRRTDAEVARERRA